MSLLTLTDEGRVSGSGPTLSNGFLLEDGVSFLLLESGDFLIQET